MFRLIHITNIAIFAIVSRIPVALAAVLLAFSLLAVLALWFWIGAQNNLAIGFVTGTATEVTSDLVFLELGLWPETGMRLVRVLPALVEFVDMYDVTWVAAIGQPDSFAKVEILNAQALHTLDLFALPDLQSLLSRLPPLALLGIACALLLFNKVVRSFACAAVAGGIGFLAVWTCLHLNLVDTGGASQLTGLVLATGACSLLATLAVRTVDAFPLGAMARVLGLAVAVAVLLFTPLSWNSAVSPLWLLIPLFIVPTLLSAIPIATVLSLAMGGLGDLFVPCVVLIWFVQIVFNTVMERFEPQHRRSKLYQVATQNLGLREPKPKHVNALGRFDILDYFGKEPS